MLFLFIPRAVDAGEIVLSPSPKSPVSSNPIHKEHPSPEGGGDDIPSLGLLKILTISEFPASDQKAHKVIDPRLINWLKENVSPWTQMPLSFYVPAAWRHEIFSHIGLADSVPGIIERNIVRDGLVIYDGALWQIVLTALGGKDNLALAMIPIRHYWNGNMVNLSHIRSGHGRQNFIYDPFHPDEVSGERSGKGKRGFIFRIINANGQYLMVDPLDGKEEFKGFPNLDRIHWEDWKPIAGENAWVVMAAMHLYHKKYYDPQRKTYPPPGKEPVELALAREIARAAMILQAGNGGVRMAPLGTYHNPGYDPDKDIWLTHEDKTSGDYRWHYHEISTENNLSWHAAFRMLWEVTKDEKYRVAMEKTEQYFKKVWNAQEHIFEQGMHYADRQWTANREYFAVDVQNLSIDVLGPEWIDEAFGEGTAFRIWQETKRRGGFKQEDGTLAGVGFTDEHDRLSIEWTGMAIMATEILAAYYEVSHPRWAMEARQDAAAMRQGVNQYKYLIGDHQAAYSYSSKRGWVPFGWFSHVPEVLSMASTCWVILNEIGFNPFYLIKE